MQRPTSAPTDVRRPLSLAFPAALTGYRASMTS
jgi:hypothetical protein